MPDKQTPARPRLSSSQIGYFSVESIHGRLIVVELTFLFLPVVGAHDHFRCWLFVIHVSCTCQPTGRDANSSCKLTLMSLKNLMEGAQG